MEGGEEGVLQYMRVHVYMRDEWETAEEWGPREKWVEGGDTFSTILFFSSCLGGWDLELDEES